MSGCWCLATQPCISSCLQALGVVLAPAHLCHHCQCLMGSFACQSTNLPRPAPVGAQCRPGVCMHRPALPASVPAGTPLPPARSAGLAGHPCQTRVRQTFSAPAAAKVQRLRGSTLPASCRDPSQSVKDAEVAATRSVMQETSLLDGVQYSTCPGAAGCDMDVQHHRCPHEIERISTAEQGAAAALMQLACRSTRLFSSLVRTKWQPNLSPAAAPVAAPAEPSRLLCGRVQLTPCKRTAHGCQDGHQSCGSPGACRALVTICMRAACEAHN